MNITAMRCRNCLYEWWQQQNHDPLGPVDDSLHDRVKAAITNDKTPDQKYISLWNEVRSALNRSTNSELTPKRRKQKPGRKQIAIEDDLAIVAEFAKGKKDGLWKTQAEFARSKDHPPAWYSNIKKRVNQRSVKKSG